jgi:fatty-acyl-CoA synthase
MSATEHAGRTSISPFDLVRALPSLLPDTPKMVRGGVAMLALKPDSAESIGYVFQRIAGQSPQRTFVKFEGQSVSYHDANEQVNRYAAVLKRHGVTPGSVVGILMTNRPETLFATLAAVKVGAIAGMLNHHQRGEVLNHSQNLLSSTVFLVGAECREALESLPAGEIAGEVIGVADRGTPLDGYPDLDVLAAGESTADPVETAQIRANAKAFYIFTSGTTGLPKASTMSHLRWLKAMNGVGRLGVRLHSDDVMYLCLPLYHNNALTVSLSGVLASGATLALSRSFSASRFWDEVIASESTAFCYIGELLRYLLHQPPKPTDRAHHVRVAVGNGLRPEIWAEFKQRFGIERIAEFYGASEGNLAFINALNIDQTAGTCPLPFAIAKYDPDSDAPARNKRGRLEKVRIGDVGLLLTKITDRAPFDGYTDTAASEKKVLRDAFAEGDAWFNTGDLVRRQGFGHIAFVDRMGDTFRWKGENVAATEVEAATAVYPDVQSAVVYGVEVPGADGRAGMAAVRMHDGVGFDGVGLARHLMDELPGYAVPLFIRLVGEFAQTSTFKNRKVELRADGYADVADPVFVLTGRERGYVPYYAEYAEDLTSGRIRI